ncbi:hypothetical protein ASE14_02890 [Agromyces sp. Root81]|uniref:TolB family protein n=1 Tax=Agromyces sp. Root81 TaxID=1736601 RepID=UPI00070205B4|nr:hypothetical protein [Agromyces sp. Root81]KRC62780.1 hypothetical protein ASE14_02890 [Agromyces sp. Root81]
MDLTGRRLFVAVAAVVLLGGAAAYGAVAFAASRSVPLGSASTPLTAIEPDTVLFRQMGGGALHGFVASVDVDDPGGPRMTSDTPCDRLDADATGLVCLHSDLGLTTTFETRVLDRRLRVLESRPLAGIPSRTRLSPGGERFATTSFVTGHSYAGSEFSTSTMIVGPGDTDSGELEDFALIVDGAEVTAADVNVWGVAFADEERFFATASSGEHRWLVRGDLGERTLTALRDEVECPSLSPDGSRIAFKQNRSDSAQPDWAIAVLDLDDDRVTVLPEPASIDDQVEWLDDDTLLYGRTQENSPGDADVYTIRADGSTDPELFIEHAWSPAVVRP